MKHERFNQAPAQPLDTLASRVSPQGVDGEEKTDWKAKRHDLRYVSGSVVGGRTQKCGCAPIGSQVDLCRGDTGGHHFSGLETCGSVWTCPVCAVKITERRRSDVREVIAKHLESGGGAVMVTLTIPHSRFDRCEDLRKAVSTSWQKVQSGKGWKDRKTRCGLTGSIRALEVTHGQNGWHPHLHIVFLFSGASQDAHIQDFGQFIFQRWSRAVERDGHGLCSEKAFSVEKIEDAEGVSKYCQKWGAAEELTKAHIKNGRAGGRSPWQILTDIKEDGSKRDKALFSEYASAFKGARQLTWTVGLRARYIEADEQSDEDIAGDPKCADIEKDRVMTIDGQVWKYVRRARAQAKFLNVADQGGSDAAIEMLKVMKIPIIIHEKRGLYGNIVPVILLDGGCDVRA